MIAQLIINVNYLEESIYMYIHYKVLSVKGIYILDGHFGPTL